MPLRVDSGEGDHTALIPCMCSVPRAPVCRIVDWLDWLGSCLADACVSRGRGMGCVRRSLLGIGSCPEQLSGQRGIVEVERANDFTDAKVTLCPTNVACAALHGRTLSRVIVSSYLLVYGRSPCRSCGWRTITLRISVGGWWSWVRRGAGTWKCRWGDQHTAGMGWEECVVAEGKSGCRRVVQFKAAVGSSC